MRLSRKHIVGLFTSIAIFSSLMLALNTRQRSLPQTAHKSPSTGEHLDPLLGVAPGRGSRLGMDGDPGPIELTNDEDLRLANWLLEAEGHPPMWWTDFWTGLGTLLLVAVVLAGIIAGVAGAMWVWHHHPLFLLVVPGLPIVALFGHYARDLFWSDPGHKH